MTTNLLRLRDGTLVPMSAMPIPPDFQEEPPYR
jgi:hypothetical protein